MRLELQEQLDFSDVLILPKRSTLKSRKDVDITRTFTFRHTGKTWTGVPVIASNMLTGTFEMASSLSEYNMMTALHKHYSAHELIHWFSNTEEKVLNNVWYSMGIVESDFDKFVDVCKDSDYKISKVLCEVANGYTSSYVDSIKRLRDKFSDLIIMAGNVVTGEMAAELILAGADAVRAGIGGGQMCLTRKIAGVGRPQLSTVIDTADACHGLKGLICSDGGCSQPADINIAFCAGSDFVMLGSMFSGTDECVGDIEVIDGKQYKKFFGMSSNSAMDEFYGGRSNYKASEGRTALVPYRGSVKPIAEEICGAIRSMCTYVGAEKLKEATKRATLIKVNNRLNSSYEKYTIGN
jgi:GMP reductase